MFDINKFFGIIKQEGDGISLEVIATLTHVRTTDVDSGEVRHLLIAVPWDVNLTFVSDDLNAVSGMSGERNVTKSYVGGITCDDLCKKLVSERRYKTLLGPKMNDIIYVRTPYESLDANLRNPSVKEWMDIGVLPQ